jgi:mitochondrial chaperone BCS1
MIRQLLESLNGNAFFSGGLTLMVIGSAVAFLRGLPSKIKGFVERRLSITVEISDRDPAFRWVEAWLAAHRYARRARDLTLRTTWVSSEVDPTIESDPCYGQPSGRASQAKFLLSPAPGMHVMTYYRRILILYRTRRELTNNTSAAYQESLSLQLIGGSRQLVEQLVAEAHANSFPTTPGVNVLTGRNECWDVTSWQPKRPLESVVLADGVLDDLLEDLREFYSSGAWYASRGIPYRRGYLLHGPPGTGKTTVVLALAGELELAVATLSLSNRLMTDEALRALVDALPAATILLIEDVDCVFKEKRGTGADIGVTLSGLLNTLDGVSSREGRVLFLTTNHPERLDPSLVRPGRVDRKVELGYATPDQARRLFLWFYRDCGTGAPALASAADEFAAQLPPAKVSMAAIQEHLVRFRRTPKAAAHEGVWTEEEVDFDPGAGLASIAELAAVPNHARST